MCVVLPIVAYGFEADLLVYCGFSWWFGNCIFCIVVMLRLLGLVFKIGFSGFRLVV